MLDESRVKCSHCGKWRSDHNAMTKACPIGSKHRTVGYTQYHTTQVFSPNPKSKPRCKAGTFLL